MTNPFTTKQRLILASGSPRRQRFLSELGLDFEIRTESIIENHKPGESPSELVQRLASEKAEIIAEKIPEAWIIGADTIVVHNNSILGKPKDLNDARKMLEKLMNSWHQVWTGFCICCIKSNQKRLEAVKTDVRFGDFSGKIIDSYLQCGESLDKAGSYALQGKGNFLVSQINGSHSNVIGLPMTELVQALLKAKIIEPLTVNP
jgi:septum formation protein